jgi:hypothetical protein
VYIWNIIYSTKCYISKILFSNVNYTYRTKYFIPLILCFTFKCSLLRSRVDFSITNGIMYYINGNQCKFYLSHETNVAILWNLWSIYIFTNSLQKQFWISSLLLHCYKKNLFFFILKKFHCSIKKNYILCWKKYIYIVTISQRNSL